MNAPDFLDANVVFHAYDPADARKQRISRDLLRRALAGELVWSSQVLVEIAVTLLHKLPSPADAIAVVSLLDAFAPIQAVSQDAGLIRRAVEAREKYDLHFCGGLIVAAAERAGCTRILSEDFTAGESYFDIKIVNPFRP